MLLVWGWFQFWRTGKHGVTVHLAVTFKPAFGGSWNVYSAAATAGGLNTGWVTMGTWTVPGLQSPQVVSVNPSLRHGQQPDFQFRLL